MLVIAPLKVVASIMPVSYTHLPEPAFKPAVAEHDRNFDDRENEERDTQQRIAGTFFGVENRKIGQESGKGKREHKVAENQYQITLIPKQLAKNNHKVFLTGALGWRRGRKQHGEKRHGTAEQNHQTAKAFHPESVDNEADDYRCDSKAEGTGPAGKTKIDLVKMCIRDS